MNISKRIALTSAVVLVGSFALAGVANATTGGHDGAGRSQGQNQSDEKGTEHRSGKAEKAAPGAESTPTKDLRISKDSKGNLYLETVEAPAGTDHVPAHRATR
ncbi:hypothetical protein [Streptomyces sp. NPDC059009]|uniref:hypothetical protein n=1 Tax=Streptomyces sp. NPDC059009 TaxID=3346694 RepID=UPI00368BF591